MLIHLALVPFLFSPPGGLKDAVARAQLMGTWRIVETEPAGGKDEDEEGPTMTFVITDRAMSMYHSGQVIWAADYRLDASKSPGVLYQTVTRAPCMCGAKPDIRVPYTVSGKRLNLDGMLLEKVRP